MFNEQPQMEGILDVSLVISDEQQVFPEMASRILGPGISLVVADTEESMIVANETVILPLLATSFPNELLMQAFFPHWRSTSAKTLSKPIHCFVTLPIPWLGRE